MISKLDSSPAYQTTSKLKVAVDKAGRDFRSDVVTVPTENMMQAILDASLGDDIYDEEGDPSVRGLEDRLAELTGMEAALWTVSGTQANQICLRVHLTQPPHSVLLDHRAHIYCCESSALPVMSQASVTPVQPKNGIHLTLDDVKPKIIAERNFHYPPTRVVALENTLSGAILPLRHAQEIAAYVRSYPVPEGQQPIAMHLDVARLFDGVVGEDVDVKAYAACFDSMSICLDKGIGAPMGCVTVGSKRFIDRARWIRKMFGGATRQPGMMAAAAHAALEENLPLFPQVHALTKATASRIEAMGYKFMLPVQTNIIVLDLEAAGIPRAAFLEYCQKQDVAVFPMGRLVFHHQTSAEGVEALISALQQLMKDKRSGVELSDKEVHGGYS